MAAVSFTDDCSMD